MATQLTPPRPQLVKGARASRTTVALKLAMAASGFIFVAFVFAHMYGNLKAFAGHDAFNEYAHHLRELGEPLLPHEGALWILRLGLIISLVVHVTTGVLLWRRAARARTTKYVVKKNSGVTRASLMMRWGGVTILVFLVWHLLNFTIGKVNPQGGATNDPYNLMVDTFDVWWMTIIYLVAMLALGAHLHHGIWSAAQTLGWTGTAAKRQRWKVIGFVTAVIISLGYSLVPLAVLAGIITK
ncbi:succinate dehydrogenase / fumarate reductase cytochrome b subunit [Nocardioides cavernae]|uniref:Succinate dehydrogenase / fumarate reductase cytochrome b subunit n=1 Tax=Nocardioides cavernae TaxID=1921566 RepID=A0A7Y9H3L4_9ACTN|nr:succinate dehydrogenase cytochrome b subunit [Nocardioides cavernae]NYE37343.1 succinate dehydrogenase / fumarate reductase cytochrome b subunit [Nocardioides cavernae]